MRCITAKPRISRVEGKGALQIRDLQVYVADPRGGVGIEDIYGFVFRSLTIHGSIAQCADGLASAAVSTWPSRVDSVTPQRAARVGAMSAGVTSPKYSPLLYAANPISKIGTC